MVHLIVDLRERERERERERKEVTGTAVLTSRPAWPRRSPAAVAGRGPSAISQKPIRDLERGGDSDVSYLAISLRDGRSKTQTQSIPFFIRIASFHVPFFFFAVFRCQRGGSSALFPAPPVSADVS